MRHSSQSTWHRIRAGFRFAWYDLWVGAYWDRKKTILYVCPLPMLLVWVARTCEQCGEPGLIEKQPCRTQYADDTQNTSPVLCAGCAEEYKDYWDEMWANYHGGLL